MRLLKKRAEISPEINAKSKVGEVEKQITNFRDFMSSFVGGSVPDSVWMMTRRVSLEFIFVKRMNWNQEKFDDLLMILKGAAEAGSFTEIQMRKFSAEKKSRIEIVEERNFWGGHTMYFDRLPFADDNMSFIFQWHLGAAWNGGATPGEMYYAATQIEDGNVESWTKEWLALAERVQARAEASLKKGQTISAYEGFLRAANYYRMPLWVVDAKKAGYRQIGDAMRACFRKAADFAEPAIEVVEIPFEGGKLPGYFVKGRQSNQPSPTLIFLGGAETFAEDGYYIMGPAALKRGFNFFTVEYPGEGLTPYDGLYHRPDEEVPVAAILDYLQTRPDVDMERIATYGISMGGYVGPRAAAHDERIKAVIANSMLYDIYPIWDAFRPLLTNEELAEFLPSIWGVMETLTWRWGRESTGDPLQLIELNKPFNLDPGLVKCPVLILIGEGEYRSADYMRTLQHTAMEVMPHPKNKLVIAKADEGAAHHCIPENPALVSEVVFDWLGEVFS